MVALAHNYLLRMTKRQINTKNEILMIVQEIKATVIFEFKDLPIVMLANKDIYHKEKQKVISEKLNCRSLGYWIDRRFYTKSKLNKLSLKSHSEIKVKELIDCPF